MKKTKKWLAAIAAVMLAFSFASCGSGDDDNNSGEIDNTNTNGDNTNTNGDNTNTNGDNTNTNGDNTNTNGENTNNGNGKMPTVAETKTTLDAVGDIYLSDGTVIAAADANKMSTEQKAMAEAVVFYMGTNDALGERTLAVNVKNSGTTTYAWAKRDTTGEATNFDDLLCVRTLSKPESGPYYEDTDDGMTYYVMDVLDGSGSWEKVKATDPTGTADDVVAENYPAFNYVNTVLGENYYLPTLAELEELYKNITTVNASITVAGGTKLSGIFFSSSQDISSARVWNVSLSDGNVFVDSKSSDYYASVCGVRNFSNSSESGTPTVAETKTTLDAVGDIYLSDGTVIAAADANRMSSEQKAMAEAVVFYVGTANDAFGNRTLAVNVKNSRTTAYAWAPSNTKGETTNFTALQCDLTDTQPESGMYYEFTYADGTAYFTGDLDGSDNWEIIKTIDTTGTTDNKVAENYPAFNYVNTVLGENYYLPTLAELEKLHKNLTIVNASIVAAGGTKLSGTFWSSSQLSGVYYSVAFKINLSTGVPARSDKINYHYVCGVRVFTN